MKPIVVVLFLVEGLSWTTQTSADTSADLLSRRSGYTANYVPRYTSESTTTYTNSDPSYLYETTTTYPTYESTLTHPSYDPTYTDEPTTTYPSYYESTTTYPSYYESASTYPNYDPSYTYESTTTYPSYYESTTTYPSYYESTTTYPSYYESTTTYPSYYESATTYPSYYESTTTYPSYYESTTSYSNSAPSSFYETTTTYPTYDSTLTYPSYDSSYPSYYESASTFSNSAPNYPGESTSPYPFSSPSYVSESTSTYPNYDSSYTSESTSSYSNYAPSYTAESITTYPTYELVGSNDNQHSTGSQSVDVEDFEVESVVSPLGFARTILLIKQYVVEMQKSITGDLIRWVKDYPGRKALAIAKYSRARLEATLAIEEFEDILPDKEFLKDGQRTQQTDEKIRLAFLRLGQKFESIKKDFNESTAEEGANPVKFTSKIDELILNAQTKLRLDSQIQEREEEDDCC